MLKVTLHHGPPKRADRHNILGRLDLAYETLDSRANYKARMFTTGVGEQPEVRIKKYPRWSASIWDLVARAACLSLQGEESIPDLGLTRRRGAFIEDLTAVVEHWPDGEDFRRNTIAEAHVRMRNRRCHYTATFEDDLAGRRESSVFSHAPEGLTHWDLLARAWAWTCLESFALPPRPELCAPLPFESNGRSLVALETTPEPARTGISRWLLKQGLSPLHSDLVTGPCVTEDQFINFLKTAI